MNLLMNRQKSNELYEALRSALKTLRHRLGSRNSHTRTDPVLAEPVECTNTNSKLTSPNSTLILLCKHCNAQFFTKKALDDHIFLAHWPGISEILTCDNCDFEGVSNHHLEEHVLLHNASRQVPKTDSVSKRHMEVNAAYKLFECDYCGHKNTSKGSLILHIRSHIDKRALNNGDKRSNYKPYKCHHCQFESAYKSSLTVHIRRHNMVCYHISTGIRKRQQLCDCCGLKSAQIARHLKSHTGEKSFKCDYCDYKSFDASEIRRHVRIHTGEKPYKCDLCGYKSSQSSHLIRHLRTHNGEKPHKCGFCDYKTSQANHLVRHLRTHTGEKPFKCDYCHYRSTCRSHVTRHTTVRHTNKMTHKLEECGS